MLDNRARAIFLTISLSVFIYSQKRFMKGNCFEIFGTKKWLIEGSISQGYKHTMV